jgi:uncharacterized protein (DUF433 family)
MRRCDNLKKGAPIMARIDTASEIDWTQCELIEQVPGKVTGRPIVRGTRILPDAIVNSYDAGEPLDLIHENYPGLSITQIQRLIEFAHARGGQPVPRKCCSTKIFRIYCGTTSAITMFSRSDIRAGRVEERRAFENS